MMSFVYFDGTSAFVDNASGATSETEVVFKSISVDDCDEFCDDYNDRI